MLVSLFGVSEKLAKSYACIAFYKLVHKNSSLDKNETTEFVAKLIDQGKMAYDPEGLLVWVR